MRGEKLYGNNRPEKRLECMCTGGPIEECPECMRQSQTMFQSPHFAPDVTPKTINHDAETPTERITFTRGWKEFKNVPTTLNTSLQEEKDTDK